MQVDAAVPTALAPTGNVALWDRRMTWTDTGESVYVVRRRLPAILSCRTPSGFNTISAAGGTVINELREGNGVFFAGQFERVDGVCSTYMTANASYQARMPGGNVKGGPCGQGNPYVYYWQVRGASSDFGAELTFTFDAQVAFTLPNGLQASISIVTPDMMDGELCEVDLVDGRQFLVTITGREMPLPRDVDAVFALAQEKVAGAMARAEFESGVRYEI